MKEKIKNVIKNNNFRSTIKYVSFFLVFVLILNLASGGYFSTVNALNYRNKYSRAYSFMAEPKDSIDIALIGNSNLYSAFVPNRLWEKEGYTSTVISSPHQTPLRSYIIMKDLLKQQSPKVMVIETDMFYEGEDEKEESVAFKKETPLLNSILAVADDKELTEMIENKFSIFLLHDHWKNFSADDIKRVFKRKEAKTLDHGYNFNNSVKSVNPNDYMKFTHNSKKVTTENLMYIDKMISLCKQKNIEVVFLEVPAVNSWSYAKHNYVSELAESYGIKFIDLNTQTDELGFDFNHDFRDAGDHLNFYGATKTTYYLADILKKDYSSVFIDKRNDEKFKYWHDSNAEFREMYNVKF